MAQLHKRKTIKLLLEANNHTPKEIAQIAQIAHVTLSSVYYVKAKLAKGIDENGNI